MGEKPETLETVGLPITIDMPEGEICWRVQIEYANHTSQEILSYQDYLMDRPEELFLALLEYFEPETDDFDEEYAGNDLLE